MLKNTFPNITNNKQKVYFTHYVQIMAIITSIITFGITNCILEDKMIDTCL